MKPRALLAGTAAMAFCAFSFIASAVAIRAQTSTSTLQHPPGAYANVNGIKLWYETEGRGEPLVLVCGGPGDPHSVFHLFFSRLADRQQVIYFDEFGVGKSERAKSSREYSFVRDVENLEGLRKALGLAKMNLLGQSYGGMVAQAYALKYPQSVERLILVDSFYSGQMWQANDDNSNREIQAQFPEAWAKLQKLRATGLRSSAPEHQEVYDSIPLGLFYFYDASKAALLPSDPSNNDVYYAIAGDDADFTIGGDIAGLDFRADLGRLTMPILIVAGRYDRISLPQYAVKYKTYAPHSRFVMMEKSGHFPYIEEPEKMLSVMRDFLGQPVHDGQAGRSRLSGASKPQLPKVQP
jgi:proline iminopeptidase